MYKRLTINTIFFFVSCYIYSTQYYIYSINNNKTKMENQVSKMYTSWDESVSPAFIKVNLIDGRQVLISKKNVHNSKKMYEFVLQAFIDDRYDLTDLIVSSMLQIIDNK